MQNQTATLEYNGKIYELPILEGAENEHALDVRTLRSATGLLTYDPGFVNSAACKSNITYINGEEGLIRFRGYDIEDLVEHCSFLEVAYLLVHGFLPNKEEYAKFSDLMNIHSLLHEDMRHFFSLFPEQAHPMAMLSAMVVTLATFYPDITHNPNEAVDITVTRLLSKLRTIAAFAYKKMKGHPVVYPKQEYSYCENLLNMMFWTPVNHYKPDKYLNTALNKLLILHADHEQNCSTAVVRSVGSSDANLYASISAGISALWGPKHGGANQSVIEMLEMIHNDPSLTPAKVIEKAKDKNDPFRLMGFGHRIYKTYDPRAKIAKRVYQGLKEHLNFRDPLSDIAEELEEIAMSDSYFQQRHLYPNVDFYTGLSYRAIGIPTNMFTVLFALGRLPGWIAQWLEQKDSPERKISRPRQLYTGPARRDLPADWKK